MSKKIDELKEAQEIAGGMVNMKVEGTKGVVDVIGIEVLSLHGNVINNDDAQAFIEKNTETSFDMINIGDQKYVVKTTVADLNKVNAVDPMDLEANTAIPIQIKISEMLEAAGLKVGINDEMKAELEKEVKIAKEKLDNDNAECE